MSRVECPSAACPGILQPPFQVPYTQDIHPAFCPSCSTKHPDMNHLFETVEGEDGTEKRKNPEAELVRNPCNRAWDQLGFAVYDLEQGYRADPGGSRQTPGIADTFIAGHGVTAWVEYKYGRNKQSAAQETFQAAVEANGGLYLLIYETGEMKAAIETLKERPDWRDAS